MKQATSVSITIHKQQIQPLRFPLATLQFRKCHDLITFHSFSVNFVLFYIHQEKQVLQD